MPSRFQKGFTYIAVVCGGMKIIWGINIPYVSQEIDFDATDARRKELQELYPDKYISFMDCRVWSPCIRYQDYSFELCEYCGNQVVGGRLKHHWKTCSKECNEKVNGAWAHHTLTMERELKGARPTFFWWKIRNECFGRDGWKCQRCGKDIRTTNNPGEAHHIIPISEGGSNKLENLKTFCYGCHKIEHSHDLKEAKKYITLDNFI